MEETVEDPPTSAVLLDHCHFAQVIFNSVEKFYVPGGDLTCYYTLTQHFIPQRKDWIGIFRVGWKTVREYYTFMWVTLPVDLNKGSEKQQEVQFKAYYLPKDDEYYQFCYVDMDGVVRGASIPFQFRPESDDDILVVTTQGEVEEIDQRNKELYQENQELKESYVSLQKRNSDIQTELQKMQGLQEELETLKNINRTLEQKVKEQKDCWERELLQLREQNQKICSENEKMGIRVDQLQAQLSTKEKEMEKLIQGDQDKTEQLEHLKKENDQLFLNLTDQRKHQKKLEQTVNEMKQKETSSAKRLQELTDQNFDLSRRLSEKELIYTTLQRDNETVQGENDLLKRENSRLLSYMGLDYDNLHYQVSASAEGGAQQKQVLVYGNPYCGIQESSSPSLASIRKCPSCTMDFEEEHTLAQHVQAHYLDCPICAKSFPRSQKQIFEDHVLCHSL
ncbi:calcium-binding and coiled-coil domain-containing protein 2 [Echinops telfairi]|uniref:Calcium-binding and coiled-coil domain-containing protein 2 n=1 Tax=Echinops telfairi TaxID=9371 RepID=A0AC55DV09_ECHTE|nr:calcium-binding and coiled-coil domain-containing protein 2 [Echinops telfairi]